MGWREQAACRDADPELFYPEVGDPGWAAHRAKLICARCPVAAECLACALDNNDRYGIWGGKTDRQRRRLKRRQVA